MTGRTFSTVRHRVIYHASILDQYSCHQQIVYRHQHVVCSAKKLTFIEKKSKKKISALEGSWSCCLTFQATFKAEFGLCIYIIFSQMSRLQHQTLRKTCQKRFSILQTLSGLKQNLCHIISKRIQIGTGTFQTMSNQTKNDTDQRGTWFIRWRLQIYFQLIKTGIISGF